MRSDPGCGITASSDPIRGVEQGEFMIFHSFEQVQNHLDHLGLFHMDFGLDRMRRALRALALSETPYPVVHIVGTNGKGSTSTFLASLATAHGLKTGLYTSPHFLTPRERIRINGAMLSPKRWTALASRVHEAAPDLTYFEFLTAAGLLAFAEEHVDLAVLEAGLGGRYDATTAAPAQLLCYTPIAMDHENVLGHTIGAIASDKAGAIRPMPNGSFVLTGPQPREALDCLARAAEESGVPFVAVEPRALPFGLLELSDPASIPRLGLAGPHQITNSRLALAAWEFLCAERGWRLTREATLKGLAYARLAGRFQFIPADAGLPPIILDGAHNPHGLNALAAALEEARIRPRAVIFSCLADKNRQEMLPLIRRIAGNSPVFTPTIQDNERAMSGEVLAEELGSNAVPAQRLRLALDAAAMTKPADAEQPVVLCGSLYLLGEFFTLYPNRLEESVPASPQMDR